MALNHSPKIVTNGLAIYLDAKNPKSYSGSGNVWSDLSGNGCTGTISNSPTFSNGIFSFNGTDQSVNIVNSIQFGSTSFSVGFWINFPVLGNASGLFSWNTDSFNSNAKGLEARVRLTGIIEYALGDGTGGNAATRVSSVGSLLTNTWYYVCYTHNFNSIITAYKNGISQGTTDYSTEGNSPFNDTYAIILAAGGNGFANIQLPNFHVYNRVLSSDEVLQNFNAIRGRYSI
jgi:hypothetical protein